MPEKPPVTEMFVVYWQLRHCMCSDVAFDESVDAPMIIPGMRTRCDTFVALRSRMDVWEAVEWRSS